MLHIHKMLKIFVSVLKKICFLEILLILIINLLNKLCKIFMIQKCHISIYNFKINDIQI